MFTGIIEEVGRLRSSRSSGGGLELELSAEKVIDDLAIGDSVAVNGVCQTVTGISGNRFRFFAMGETLRATNLGTLRSGDKVNLERALTPTSRLGGHFVTGHVDGTARIRSIRAEAAWSTFYLEMAESLLEQLVPKGSIAVDGISLTIGPEIHPDGCEVYLIPHTLEATRLGSASAGETVNIETDLLGKYVLRYMSSGESRDESLLGLLASEGLIGGDKR